MSPGPLSDLRVVDCATLIAGPGCARYLADFGADVVKVERPGTGDGARRLGWTLDGDDTSVWWRLLGRNKRCVALDLSTDDGREAMLRLCRSADVLVENFRPGTLERLGLGPEVLLGLNPKLVITRVSGFGQTGPYAARPGFATLAEAMSGFASINGEPDGAPLLPPIALTDEVAALVGAFATMVAVHSGVGQVVDVNLLESMVQLMGALPTVAAMIGYDQPRLGAGIPYSVPRNTYRTADGRWVAVSTSSEPVAHRLLELVGIGDDGRLATSAGRAEHRRLIDGAVSDWIGVRPAAEVLEEFTRADVAAAPVLTMTELLHDRHVMERGLMEEVDGFPMPGPVARLSATPGVLRWAGRPLGADQDLADGRAPGPAPPPAGRLDRGST